VAARLAPMISVVIPTLDAEPALGATLAALVPAAVDGVVREVIIVDGGSRDRTVAIGEEAGALVLATEPGRGRQLHTGALRARWPWLLFLHADTSLGPGWAREAAAFIEAVEHGRRPFTAAAFRFALDDVGFRPRLMEAGVAFRCAMFRLPYGDQALLVSKRLYLEVGGFRPLTIMEDVDLVRRLGRRRIVMLRTPAVTSADRFRRAGYARRVMRNLSCLALFYARAPIATIERLYGP
jgi:rSAM/selenodomain-associated transferase 2